MSDTPGWTRPGDEPPDEPRPGAESGHPPGWSAPHPPPAYPGWSPQQPPPAYPGWAPQQPPPAYPGWAPQQQPGWGGQPPGWAGQPPGWAGQPPGGGISPQPPSVKPGVVPLRPLGVGEILDGAITSVRDNPRTMLGLSAIVAVLSQLLQLGLVWIMYRDLSGLEQLTVQPGLDEVVAIMADTFTVGAISALITFLATTILTGILTMSVSRAVLGERIDAATAWRMARPQLLRLIGLTILIGILVALPLVIAPLPGLLIGLAGSEGAGVAVAALGIAVALPVSIWLYVRLALSTPALMLESSLAGGAGGAGGGQQRTRVTQAMRRSARLVAGGWWRMFGILLLVIVITWLVQQVIAIPATLLGFLVGGFGLVSAAPTFGGLALASLAGFIGLTITMPFSAAVTVLLYVDRRIRREGLDIELARAAGVSIPGRTE